MADTKHTERPPWWMPQPSPFHNLSPVPDELILEIAEELRNPKPQPPIFDTPQHREILRRHEAREGNTYQREIDKLAIYENGGE